MLDPKFHWLRQIATTLRQYHWHLFSIGHCAWFYTRGKRGSYLVLAIAPFWSWFESGPKIVIWRSQWNLGYTSTKELHALGSHQKQLQQEDGRPIRLCYSKTHAFAFSFFLWQKFFEANNKRFPPWGKSQKKLISTSVWPDWTICAIWSLWCGLLGIKMLIE